MASKRHRYSSRTLDQYFTEIGNESLLTPEEEITLARLAREGQQEALDKILRSNLRFVVTVAKKYQNHGLSLEDLISEGNIGLIKAAKRFDETRGFKFISYAVWWIRQSILQAISQQSRIVRLPLNKVDAVSKMRKIYQELEKEFDREPTTEEIAEAMELTRDEIEDTIQAAERELSVDEPRGKDDATNLLEILPEMNTDEPGDELIDESLHHEVEEALATLDEREADIIRRYFGIGFDQPLTLEQIGSEYDLTRERIRQIKEKALQKLRHTSRTKILKKYLGE
ncbi:MAG: RNA polymerase sigma factor RpoD/SigA [Candidatus Marinimicrobia bacterium]|nr:RNA polymerase sigma factor RpoD/SigA [Candidatus Neomarinimicrobiota bacterium]MCF7828935.1 RNA polymerase sigma factor RpoD/SigA [Candidatus Neomarinimicrobiota bacterium]MCF7879895.1 RNA polymerase sigma factor RpoD/SigA [Candidatus Neomarinimicrobiota bacterium]